MTFAHPLMLFGMLGVALPVLIHLILRPRPRRVRFPAATLLRRSLAAGQRAHRLSRLWLLLARMLLIAALVWILAGPIRGTPEGGGDEPRSAVFVIDDSWSTHYRDQADRTISDALRDAVRTRLDAARNRPPGSTIGLVRAASADDLLWPTDDRSLVLDALNRTAPVVSSATLRDALEASLRALAASRPGPRELVIFSDGKAHAWRDGAGSVAGIDNLSIELVAPSLSRTNLAIVGIVTPPRVHPADTPLAIRAIVSSERLEASVTLTVLRGDTVLTTTGPIDVSAGGEREVELLLPGLPAGAHGLRIELSPPDRLDEDQRRYVALEFGRRPRAGLLLDNLSGASLTKRIVQNMLAPAGLSPERQRLDFRLWTPVVIASAEAGAERPDLLVVLPLSELSNAARDRLREWVEQGTQILLMPDAAVDEPDWPGLRRWIAARPPRIETLDSPVRMRWRAAGSTGDASEGLPELERATVRTRLRWIEPEAGLDRIVDFSDDQPAVLAARVGRGRILQLATTPAPSWSDLGIYAAGLITWLHELALHDLATPTESENVLVGQAARVLPEVEHVRRHGNGERWTVSPSGWTPREAGIYEQVAGDRVVAITAANWPPEESDGRAITAEEIAERMRGSPENVTISRPQDGFERGSTEETRILAAVARGAAPLALLLLLLLEATWSRPKRDIAGSKRTLAHEQS